MESTVELKRRKEFEAVLENYHVSDHAKAVLKKTKLVLLVGLAAGGRNTIINELVKTGHYHFLVSDTTRPPKLRDGQIEQDGVQYFFRDEDELLEDLRKGEFLEAEIIHAQQVSGISIRELVKANEADKIVINEVEIGGAENVIKLKPDTVLVFILPPSFDVWHQRFQGREEISKQEYLNRIRTAKRNLSMAIDKPYYSFVINDSLPAAVSMIDKIARTGHDNSEHDRISRKVAREILAQVNETLKELEVDG